MQFYDKNGDSWPYRYQAIIISLTSRLTEEADKMVNMTYSMAFDACRDEIDYIRSHICAGCHVYNEDVLATMASVIAHFTDHNSGAYKEYIYNRLMTDIFKPYSIEVVS